MISPNPQNPMIRYFLSLLLLPTLLLLPLQQSNAQDDEPFLSIGERRTLDSSVLGESRDIIVGLPSDYDDGDDSYPVIYLLDGPGHFHHTTGTARFLARHGRMPGVIVVAIPNTDRTRDLTPPTRVDSLGTFPTAGGADNFLAFISDELKPYIAENYRTRPYSILIGHSFGGLFANHALVHRPDVFNAYISISPSLWWDEQRLVAQADSAFDHVDELVGDFYMTMGNEGNAMLGGALKFAGVLEEKAPSLFRWEFKLMEEEDHGSVPHRSTYYGLEKIFEGWHLHEPVSLYESGGVLAIDRYFEHASERFGYERSTPGGVLRQIGNKALEDKNVADAEAIFSRIAEQTPHSAVGHIGLAEAHILMGHEDVAIEHYKHALSNDPKNREARDKLTEFGVDLSAYPETVNVPTHVLESYVGTYSDSGNEYEIVLDEQELSLIVGGKYEMYAISFNRFRLEIAEVYVIFKTDDSGSIAALTIEDGGESTEATRIK